MRPVAEHLAISQGRLQYDGADDPQQADQYSRRQPKLKSYGHKTKPPRFADGERSNYDRKRGRSPLGSPSRVWASLRRKDPNESAESGQKPTGLCGFHPSIARLACVGQVVRDSAQVSWGGTDVRAFDSFGSIGTSVAGSFLTNPKCIIGNGERGWCASHAGSVRREIAIMQLVLHPERARADSRTGIGY